jgi:type IV pilus assembly protein PilM
MSLFTSSKLSAIGFEADPHEFRAVQLIRSDKGVSTIAWAIFPRQAQADSCTDPKKSSYLPEVGELRWASSILERRGFVGNTLSLATPTTYCSSHNIELPPESSGAPIEQLARMEVARARRCGPEDFEFGYWSLPQSGRTTETLAVACPRELIDTTMERFQIAGLEVAGIDLKELSIYRGSQADIIEVENEINASLHIGWFSSIAVLTLGGRVIYVRRIEQGACSVWDQAISRHRLSVEGANTILHDLELPDQSSHDDCGAHVDVIDKIRRSTWTGFASELAKELDVAVGYVSHSYRTAPLGSIRVSGYGAGNPIVHTHLDEVLGIPVEVSCPTSLLESISRDKNQSQSEVSIASRLSSTFGLAARFDR